MYAGVDIAKATFEAAVHGADECCRFGGFANTEVGFEQLAEVLTRKSEQLGVGIHLVVEPTGGYELALVAFARERGWQVSMVNPRKVRDWAKGTGWRAKTDGQDALMLSAYGAACHPAPQQGLPANAQELDNLLRRKDDLAKMLREERNRQESLGRPGMSAAVPASIGRVVDALEKELAQVEGLIREHIAGDEELKGHLSRLIQVPGIGERNAPHILVFLYRWRATTGGEGQAKGLVAYTGIDPKPYVSGTSVRRRAGISRMGSSEIRQRLYMSALGGVHGDNALRAFYQRLVGRGKAKKLALVAASRKILVWAWAVFCQKADFDPARAGAIT